MKYLVATFAIISSSILLSACGKTGKVVPPGPESEVTFPGKYPSEKSCGCGG